MYLVIDVIMSRSNNPIFFNFSSTIGANLQKAKTVE